MKFHNKKKGVYPFSQHRLAPTDHSHCRESTHAPGHNSCCSSSRTASFAGYTLDGDRSARWCLQEAWAHPVASQVIWTPIRRQMSHTSEIQLALIAHQLVSCSPRDTTTQRNRDEPQAWLCLPILGNRPFQGLHQRLHLLICLTSWAPATKHA